jgi:hypothetical protein
LPEVRNQIKYLQSRSKDERQLLKWRDSDHSNVCEVEKETAHEKGSGNCHVDKPHGLPEMLGVAVIFAYNF